MAICQQFFDQPMQRLTQSSTAIILFLSVWGVKKGKNSWQKALVLPSAIILSAALGYWLDSYHLEALHLSILLLFFIITAWETAKQVLFTGEINGNKILGAICLYMLIGLTWAILFTMLELYVGHSFNGITPDQQWYELLPTFVYFSFITLTTVGYGDISPSVPLGQFLVYFEALVSQFYMAILVASLVGAHMTSYASPSKEKNEHKH